MAFQSATNRTSLHPLIMQQGNNAVCPRHLYPAPVLPPHANAPDSAALIPEGGPVRSFPHAQGLAAAGEQEYLNQACRDRHVSSSTAESVECEYYVWNSVTQQYSRTDPRTGEALLRDPHYLQYHFHLVDEHGDAQTVLPQRLEDEQAPCGSPRYAGGSAAGGTTMTDCCATPCVQGVCLSAVTPALSARPAATEAAQAGEAAVRQAAEAHLLPPACALGAAHSPLMSGRERQGAASSHTHQLAPTDGIHVLPCLEDWCLWSRGIAAAPSAGGMNVDCPCCGQSDALPASHQSAPIACGEALPRGCRSPPSSPYASPHACLGCSGVAGQAERGGVCVCCHCGCHARGTDKVCQLGGERVCSRRTPPIHRRDLSQTAKATWAATDRPENSNKKPELRSLSCDKRTEAHMPENSPLSSERLHSARAERGMQARAGLSSGGDDAYDPSRGREGSRQSDGTRSEATRNWDEGYGPSSEDSAASSVFNGDPRRSAVVVEPPQSVTLSTSRPWEFTRAAARRNRSAPQRARYRASAHSLQDARARLQVAEHVVAVMSPWGGRRRADGRNSPSSRAFSGEIESADATVGREKARVDQGPGYGFSNGVFRRGTSKTRNPGGTRRGPPKTSQPGPAPGQRLRQHDPVSRGCQLRAAWDGDAFLRQQKRSQFDVKAYDTWLQNKGHLLRAKALELQREEQRLLLMMMEQQYPQTRKSSALQRS